MDGKRLVGSSVARPCQLRRRSPSGWWGLGWGSRRNRSHACSKGVGRLRVGVSPEEVDCG